MALPEQRPLDLGRRGGRTGAGRRRGPAAAKGADLGPGQGESAALFPAWRPMPGFLQLVQGARRWHYRGERRPFVAPLDLRRRQRPRSTSNRV